MIPTDLRAAIVDLDGTMVDTLGDFQAALAATFAELDLEAPDSGFIAATIGKGSRHLLTQSLRHVGVADPATLYERAWLRYQHHYAEVNGLHSRVFSGVVEGLQDLQASGLRLACLTNKPLAFARELLRRKALDAHFEQVFGGDSFARQKPDPLPLQETCRALGTRCAETLMVGDSSNDAAAARAAGCPVVLVSYGYNHGQPASAVDADGVIDSLADLPRLLGR
jgi:phosphoglycolate phosphatase